MTARRGVRRDAFGPRDIATLDALAEALLPSSDVLPAARPGGEVAASSAAWDPVVRRRLLVLVRAWEQSPRLATGRAFTRLPPQERTRWVERSLRSRVAPLRLVVSALKQLVLVVWAGMEDAEAALRYDYRCLADGDAHGTTRTTASRSETWAPGPVPVDLMRPGPAHSSGAIVVRRAVAGDDAPVGLVTESWPDLGDGEVVTCDAVVIGSGAGGATAAAELAASGAAVVVLEEGDRVDAETDFVGPMFDRFQRFCRDNATTQVWGTPPIPLPLGRVVGGTTVVNSGTCFRTPRRVLDRWAREHGVADASYDDLVPDFEAVEDVIGVRPVPWDVLGANGALVHRGAVALGLTGGPLLRNIRGCHGCGQCAFGCPTNAKQAMHVTYLPRAQAAGARIFARCRADRIVHDGGSVRGVEATLLDHRRRPVGKVVVRAHRVVIAAGAIHTPVLLRRSAVPDPSRQTGRNLRIHPATGVAGFFDEDIVSWRGTLQSYYIDALFDSHEVMFEATSTLPGVGAGSLPGMGRRLAADLGDLHRMVTLGFYVSDTSAGRVRAFGREVVPTYRLNALDTRRIAAAIAVAAEVLVAAGARRVYPGIPGIDSVSTAADVAALRERAVRPGHLRLTAFHPMGTARMGGDPGRSVVDSLGRHREVGGLWVADASTFPTCVGVNPQVSIMAFARRTARAVVARG